MQVRFSPKQLEWITKVTGEENLQDAIDFFVECMRKENINPSEILTYVGIMMQQPFPGQGTK